MNENQSEVKNISWTDVCRKVIMTFGSMRFSFLLLFLLIIACLAGSIIPQQAGEAAYIQQYGETAYHIIRFLRVDHVFTAWWFIFLTGLLCMNLILCSISRFPVLWREWNRKSPKQLGLWGSWITHLGMLLLVVTFALSQWTAKEYVVYGIPGSTQPIGDTGYSLSIDSFETKLRDDFTVEQYEAGLTVTGEDGTSLSGTSSVNYPFSAFGYTLYQDSTGWAQYCDIYEDGEVVKTDLLCTGEYTYPEQLPSLCLMFYKFYPDFVENGDGTYSSLTPLLNNPKSLYCLYYGDQLMQMDFAAPGQKIDAQLYQFVLRDPVQYTLIVIKSDPMAKFVAAAALVLLAGLFISFYVKPMEMRRMQAHGAENEQSDLENAYFRSNPTAQRWETASGQGAETDAEAWKVALRGAAEGKAAAGTEEKNVLFTDGKETVNTESSDASDTEGKVTMDTEDKAAVAAKGKIAVNADTRASSCLTENRI